MNQYKLLQPAKMGLLELENRIVMAPLTRSRAIGNLPNELMLDYYVQRSGAGLIITEGTSPSPNGLGYARIPGIFNAQQVLGWKKICTAVHEKGSKIFIQLMHTGRISHPLNMQINTEILAPSAIAAEGQIWTDQVNLQDYPVPKEMSIKDILDTRDEFVQAAKNAMTAGFDGVEIHSANGYLLEQFLSPGTNIRKDEYGGTMQNRCRFVLEIVAAVAEAIGKEKTGIRLSPYGASNNMPYYSEISDTYDFLSETLNERKIAYIHLIDHSSIGSPTVPIEIKEKIRHNFSNFIILSGGYDKEKAEIDLQSGLANLIAFGRPFINNPDLVERLTLNWPLSQELHSDLLYMGGEKGYTDYPFFKPLLN